MRADNQAEDLQNVADSLGPSGEELNGRRALDRIHPADLRSDDSFKAVVVERRESDTATSERDHLQLRDLSKTVARQKDYIAAIAHDFREPLRAISIFTSLLAQKVARDPEATLLAHDVAVGVTRIEALFEALNEYVISGLQDRLQPVDLEGVMTGLMHDLHPAISSSAATVTWDPLPLVQGDEKLLLRLFQNLLTNAIKYHGEAPVQVHVRAESAGTDFVIMVQDNGIGIDAQYHQRVFGMLKRLHGREIPGSGIGLAICQRIVEEMGGTIWVESRLGLGSTFCFTIAAGQRTTRVEASQPRPVKPAEIEASQ